VTARLAALRIPLVLVAAASCLVAGVSLPILDATSFLVLHRPFSILDGVRALFDDGDWLIAGVIFCFSVAFPLLKIGALFVLWARLRRGERPPSRVVALLQSVGKWSMLDVFVLALVIFALKSRSLADAHTAVAIYPFVAAIALTAYAGAVLRRDAAEPRRPPPD
jgi:paraquat-inducible protein A